MNKIIKTAAVCLLTGFIIAGCSDESITSALPDDTPWNKGANAVLETESGYYTNTSYQLFLRYIDKETGNTVPLCTRPECPHDGREDCTATYKNLATTNTVLYNGDLYFVSMEDKEETVGYFLYKVKGDGSSLDKIGDVFSVKNTAEQRCRFEDNPFIIHRGYAYIPFHLAIGEGTVNSYAGSGIIKMNIKTGEKEQIISGENYFDHSPEIIGGFGNYIYFRLSSQTNREDWSGYRRYNITDGSISSTSSIQAVLGDKAYSFNYHIDDEALGTTRMGIAEYDANTLEYIRDIAELDSKHLKYWDLTMTAYDDMLFIYGKSCIEIYGTDGSFLGRLDFEEPVNFQTAEFNISDGKIYMFRNSDVVMVDENGNYIGNCYDVYCCPIEDIISGKGSWNEAFSIARSGNMYDLD